MGPTGICHTSNSNKSSRPWEGSYNVKNLLALCVCVCVCVCERERERERESVSVCVSECVRVSNCVCMSEYVSVCV